VKFLCRVKGVEVIHGSATLISSNVVEVKTGDASQRIICDNVVIVNGSKPIENSRS
jgi:pyruvate/2-oxoglutarate dehydrogenase complex dihydrolipoamide dehydrogenase (E3) component